MNEKRPTNPIVDVLASMDGAVIAGGCDSCEAVQEMKNTGGGVFILEVRHDDECPMLKRTRGES